MRLHSRAVTAVAVNLLVVFAGCAGVLDSAEDRAKDAVAGAANDAANDALNDSVGGMLNESRVGDLANAPANVTMVGFGFDQPETYTYEIVTSHGSRSNSGGQPVRGRLVVDVREVSEGNVTLTTRYEHGGETVTRTLSGTQEEVAVEFVNATRFTNPSSPMATLRTHMSLALALGTSLYLTGYVAPFVEGQFPQSGDDAMNYDAAGTDSYAGVECSVTTVSSNGTTTAESCVSTGLGLPVHVAIDGENGTADTRVTLVEYERP